MNSLITSSAYAPAASVGGFIYEVTSTGYEPIPGVVVTIAGFTSLPSDELGYYAINIPETGTLLVSSSAGPCYSPDPYAAYWEIAGSGLCTFSPFPDPSPGQDMFLL